jgi:hypothetical protein
VGTFLSTRVQRHRIGGTKILAQKASAFPVRRRADNKSIIASIKGYLTTGLLFVLILPITQNLIISDREIVTIPTPQISDNTQISNAENMVYIPITTKNSKTISIPQEDGGNGG